MSFIINQNFDLKSAQWNFERDYFKDIASLKAAPETNFPDHFITNVAGVLYQLTKSNSVDETTGKWRKVKLGSDVDLSAYAKKSEAIGNIGIDVDTSKAVMTVNKVDGTPTTVNIPAATEKLAGLLSSTDKLKLDGIAEGANKYTLPTATTAALGGIKTGYTTNGKNYKVDVDASGNAYVNVPWTDTKTDISNCAKLDSDNTFNGVITAKGFKLPNGSAYSLLTANGSILTLDNLVKRSYSATEATGFSIDWVRQFDGYTTSDSFVNNTTGFGLVRNFRGGSPSILIDSTGAININGGDIKLYNSSSGDETNALTFDGSAFSIKSSKGTDKQYYAADGSIQTLEALSNTEIDALFA